MGRLDYHELTIRKRPHFQPLEATLFITFRLAGSIPKSEVRYYKERRNWLKDQLKRVERMVNEGEEHSSWLARIQKLDREWFIKCEDLLHRHAVGPTWMLDERVADKVAENLHRLDGKDIRVDSFSIMSNHVHTVFRPLVDAEIIKQILRTSDDLVGHIPAISKIMHALKGRSARECNLILGRTGSLWEHESFDRVIREGKFHRTIRYVLNNPVKIGIVRDWQEYRWNYCRKELVELFGLKR